MGGNALCRHRQRLVAGRCALGVFGDDAVHSLHDFLAASVVHGNHQGHTRVVAGLLPCLGECLARTVGQHGIIADGHDAHAFLVKLVDLGEHGLGEQLHQADYFRLGAVPVLGRERIERQIADTDIRSGTDRLSDGPDSGFMACKANAPPFLRPTAVAVHDHSDMLRDALQVELG